ncbi:MULTISPECIES: hypothetical protein [Microterricola]|uniref:hypothetical protein n=1 Tax=Microterricola TaxID=518733 RepID=UPI0010573E12|nr:MULTISPECIES: hypothetical protein [Microterricola]
MSETAASEPVQPRPETEPAQGAPVPHEPVETVVAHETLRVRRAPKVTRFLAIGVGVGVVAALILTMIFPENDDYDRGQVFGFLLLFCGAVGLGLGALTALILDRRAARRSVTVVADRIDAHSGDNSQ